MMSSIPYCQLVTNDWKDTFKVHLDSKDQVYHVDYYAGENSCTDGQAPLVPESFKTTIQLVKPVQGPKPRLVQMAQNKPVARAVGGDKEGVVEIQEEQSFFRKYWYIIAIGGFLLVTSAAPPPEESK
ncbi:hypothetical protein CLU79DRAFT_751372 [Phycomyces nitens]|nr:hypothetical protein CLU79DRAFT_751372 [Phycomyces nitens]